MESKPRRRKVKVVDGIIESLRQDIVTRKLPDGERLPNEKDLSDRFGVSQPTVREAIRALETLGLIEVFHGSGSFVRSQGGYALASALQTLLQLEGVSVMDVLNVRQVLGRYSVELAASNATDEDIAAINLAYIRFDHLAQVTDIDGVIDHVIDFQRAVSAASHNSLLHSLEVFLLSLLNEVQVKALVGRSIEFWQDRALDFQSHRRAILRGLKSREPRLARQAMDRYFAAQHARFERDDDLRALNLANPNLINIVANMVRHIRPL